MVQQLNPRRIVKASPTWSKLKPVPPVVATLISLVNSIPPEREPRPLSKWVVSNEKAVLIEQLSRGLPYQSFGSYESRPSIGWSIWACQVIHLVRATLVSLSKVRANPHVLPVSFPCIVEVGDDGKVKAGHIPLIKAIEDVEADRIRECPICQNVFWAGRKDQLCCAPRCARILRTRRWRERYPERYKLNRFRKAEQRQN